MQLIIIFFKDIQNLLVKFEDAAIVWAAICDEDIEVYIPADVDVDVVVVTVKVEIVYQNK